MCISILSTTHPEYPFILLSNRDEFLNRPTSRAAWWDAPHDHVYGGRDLQRPERGTWLSITKHGRFAVLTNFREEGVQINREKSRGGIVNDWLTADPAIDESEESFVDRLLNDYGVHDTGGFTLLFGRLNESTIAGSADAPASKSAGLAVISNHTEHGKGLQRIAKTSSETHGLSNSWYGDLSWPKVVHGEMLLKQAVAANVSRGDSQEHFIESLFDVLSVDTLPRRQVGEVWELYSMNMRKSIFIPPAKGEAVDGTKGDKLATSTGERANGTALVQVGPGSYGTRSQAVILVNRAGQVTYVERTLYDENGIPMPAEVRDRIERFQIEGWQRND